MGVAIIRNVACGLRVSALAFRSLGFELGFWACEVKNVATMCQPTMGN